MGDREDAGAESPRVLDAFAEKLAASVRAIDAAANAEAARQANVLARIAIAEARIRQLEERLYRPGPLVRLVRWFRSARR